MRWPSVRFWSLAGEILSDLLRSRRAAHVPANMDPAGRCLVAGLRGAGRVAANSHAASPAAAEDPPVLVAGDLPRARAGTRGRHAAGGLPQAVPERRRAAGDPGGRGRGPHAPAPAPHEPHLLRRTDLPEHRPEPLGPEAGADVQRRRGRVRPAAMLQRGIQQTAVCLPAPAERPLSRVRRFGIDRLRVQRRGDGPDGLRRLPSRRRLSSAIGRRRSSPGSSCC